MAESVLHLRMKDRVSRELVDEGYSVFHEPPFAPSRFLDWSSYRPDLLGVKTTAHEQEYAFVECETNPSTKRLAAKNFRSVRVQLRLNSTFALRRLLVVPRGSLHRLEPSVRYSWETWIYEEDGRFQRFPKAVPPTNDVRR
ncbi:MAG: hypothetical protein OK455_09070 [Thaumarchaeota archaeon]|nr:hypothetical protein [Nitrososphaerota archaeon]